MKTVFIIIGSSYGEGYDVLGVATNRPEGKRILAKARRSNAAKSPLSQHGYIHLGEYRVGIKHLGEGEVLPPIKKAKKLRGSAVTYVIPRVVPCVAPEHTKLVASKS